MMKPKDKMSLNLPKFMAIYTVLFAIITLLGFFINNDDDSSSIIAVIAMVVSVVCYFCLAYITIKLSKINTYFSIATIMVLIEFLTIGLTIILAAFNMYINTLNVANEIASTLNAAFFLVGSSCIVQKSNSGIQVDRVKKYSIIYALIACALELTRLLLKVYGALQTDFLRYLVFINDIIFIIVLIKYTMRIKRKYE